MRGLIQWAVSGAALILIVLAVRYLFRNKLSARLRYALWGVVLLRLLVPFQVELPADAPVPVLASNAVPELGQWEERSIPVFPEGSKPVAEFDLDIEATLKPGDILSYSDKVGCRQRSADGETIIWYRYLLSPEQIVLALWLAGAGLTGAVILLSNLRFGLRLRKRRVMLGRPHPSSPAAMPPSPKGEGLAPRGTGVPVYMAEGLASPCLFGVFSPAVYLSPETAEDETALRHVLAHELTHYAHKDHLWSLLRCLALALHWYDPLVWVAAALSKQDGELACDEGAVARLGEEERIPYGRTLVDMVAKRSLRPADLLSMSTAMTGGGKSVKQRVAQIVKKSETVKTALFAAIALVALAVVFVFTGREEQRPDLYGPYRYQVGRTQAVRYSPSPFSSQSYPDAIADPDLLEKALDILDHAADLLNAPEELDLDLSDAPFLSPRVTLLEGPDGSGHTYLLYTAHAVNGDRCYLVTPAEIGAESYAVAAVLDTSAPGALELLARQQRSRKLEDPPSRNAGPDRVHPVTGNGEPAQTDKDLLREVLLGQAQFQFFSGEGGVSSMDIRSIPSLFSPDSSYAALGEFAVVDLDGDGAQEVVVHTADVGNDLTGYLVLRQEDGEVYGYPSGWRTFWSLKTDGTFDYSLWNGSEDGTASLRLYGDGQQFFQTHLLATGPGNGADFDTFMVNGRTVTEEEYRTAVKEQQAKPDAVWYDFSEVDIRAVFP